MFASLAAARLPSRSSRCLTRLDCPPRLLVSVSGELGRPSSLLPAVVCLVPGGGGVACFVGADEYVDCVNCLSSVDCVRAIGYILNRALSRVR